MSDQLHLTASVHQLVAGARLRLRAAGIPFDEAGLDARLIAQEVLGWDAARFLTSASERAPDGFEAIFESLVARRVAREPLPYVVGHREFWNLEFVVSPAVLIPRPETELMVEAALELFPGTESQIRVVDACTGSGCLAIAFAHERPNARVVATDVSTAALDIARQNVERHEVASRVELVHIGPAGRIFTAHSISSCRTRRTCPRGRDRASSAGGAHLRARHGACRR